VTLETVHAVGLGPAEVEELVLARAASVPEGAVARLYIDGVDPEAYRLLDLDKVYEAGAAALVLKLEPTFLGAHTDVELPDLSSLASRWERYLQNQELAGYDRGRIEDLGREYLARAVEES
jgi:hypothetical protein